MTMFSPAILGANPTSAQSFSFAFNGSAGAAVAKALVMGGYVLQCDQDVLVKVGLTATLAAVTALPSSQPTVDNANATVRVRAGTDYPLDVPADNMSISVLGFTATGGTLTVNGPITFSQVK